MRAELIRYRLAPGRPLGSGERNYRLRNEMRELVPLKERLYDFVDLNLETSAASLDIDEDN
jgi:hypothetical protein